MEYYQISEDDCYQLACILKGLYTYMIVDEKNFVDEFMQKQLVVVYEPE